MKRFNANKMIDDLTYFYGNDENQLLSITDNGHCAFMATTETATGRIN